jgi:DNA-binding NtrC family response regulator
MPAVLVVDDEALIRWSVAETLEAEGYTVLEAGSAREALERFADGGNGIGLAVLDLRLPDCADLALLRRIREIAPECRIILMTAYGSTEVLDEARRAGAIGVLGKPFDMTRVVGLVHSAMPL